MATDDPLDRVRRTYDTIAARYQAEIADELDHKPLDRAILDAFVASVESGPIADVGCGPGHVTAYLARGGLPTLGIDLSPEMVARAQQAHPTLRFEVGSMTALDAADEAWGAATVLYAVIHLDAELRELAYREFARVIRAGGLLLVAFHVEAPEQPSGSVLHLDRWWDHDVDVDAQFLDPEAEEARMAAAGFERRARIDRESVEGEYPSRRTILWMRRLP